MIDFISQAWPWYVSGPMIAFVMFLLLYAGGFFGVSSNLRSLCAIGGAGKNCSFFNYDWKSQTWNLVFILGAIIGGFISTQYLASDEPLSLSSKTIQDLKEHNISFNGGLAPKEIFSFEHLFSFHGFIVLILGGFLVGFGSRWAGGCTSGHAISGLSNLQLPSLIAVIGFFIGGLIMTHLFFPIIF